LPFPPKPAKLPLSPVDGHEDGNETGLKRLEPVAARCEKNLKMTKNRNLGFHPETSGFQLNPGNLKGLVGEGIYIYIHN